MLLLVVGFGSPPKSGTFGFFRSVALLIFIVGTISLPVSLFGFLYNIEVSMLRCPVLFWIRAPKGMQGARLPGLRSVTETSSMLLGNAAGS